MKLILVYLDQYLALYASRDIRGGDARDLLDFVFYISLGYGAQSCGMNVSRNAQRHYRKVEGIEFLDYGLFGINREPLLYEVYLLPDAQGGEVHIGAP